MSLREITTVPDLESAWLADLAAALLRRRKALRHRGRFHVAHDPDDHALEWISAEYAPPGPWPAVQLQATGHGRVTLTVESTARADRGRRLLRLDDLPVGTATDPKAVAARFEHTIDDVSHARGAEEASIGAARARWSLDDISS